MCSVAFAVALRLVGARVNTVFYPDKTHTDLFLQVCVQCFSCVCSDSLVLSFYLVLTCFLSHM